MCGVVEYLNHPQHGPSRHTPPLTDNCPQRTAYSLFVHFIYSVLSPTPPDVSMHQCIAIIPEKAASDFPNAVSNTAFILLPTSLQP